MELTNVHHYHEPITSFTTDTDIDYIKIGKVWYLVTKDALRIEISKVKILELSLKEYYAKRLRKNRLL